MNQAELTAAIAAHTDLPKATVRQVLDSQGVVIARHLASGDAYTEREVTLPVLGKLKSSTRAARTGRNPKTGEAVQIPEKVTVRLSAGKALNDILNPD
ncbi:hypothetical protein dqs_0595 [Azoarcus olearius]|nr:hypothetical protein dqs_0595 [Azoarcus olearius]